MASKKHLDLFPPGCFNPFVEMQWYRDDDKRADYRGEKKRKRIDHVNSDNTNKALELQAKARRQAAQR